MKTQDYPTEVLDVRINNMTHEGLGFARHITLRIRGRMASI